MSNLKVIETYRSECVASVVAMLEQALEEAKSGQVIAAGLAVVRPDCAINTAFSKSDNVGPLLGACTLLSSRVLANIE